jgi:menaquinone reductase, multiheme cytochrome c subunit
VNRTGTWLLGGGFTFSLAFGWFLFPYLLYKTEAQPLQFSHKTHTGDKVGMVCSDCHALAADGRFQGIPAVAQCSTCHASPVGTSSDEKVLVERYITPGKEIPWRVYSRQPDNAYFPHAVHLKLGELKCEDCHGPHGKSARLRDYQVNRISGYSRDIWGSNISGIPTEPWQGMKMDRCVRCHAQHGRRDGCIDCHK